MDKKTAEHCKVLVDACATQLGHFSRYIIDTFPVARRKAISARIGTVLGELYEISEELYKRRPELTPDRIERRMAQIINRERAEAAPKSSRKRRKRSRAKPAKNKAG